MAELPPDPTTLGMPSEAVVAVPAAGQLLYRIILDEKPAIQDLLSNHDKHNRQMGREPWLFDNGLSMLADAGQAAEMRDRFRRGQHLAETVLNPGMGIMLARTLKTPGHHTVWGCPEDLLMLALEHRGILSISNGDDVCSRLHRERGFCRRLRLWRLPRPGVGR